MHISVRRFLLSIVISFAVVFTAFRLVAAELPAVPIASYETRVFFKHLLWATGKTKEQKIRAFNRAITLIDAYAAQNPEKIEIQSLEQYRELMMRNLPAFHDLDTEIEFLRDREALPPVQLQITNKEVAEQIEKLKQIEQEKLRELVLELTTRIGKPHELDQLAKDYNVQLTDLLSGTAKQIKHAVRLLRNLGDETKIQLIDAVEAIYADVEREFFERLQVEARKKEIKLSSKGLGIFLKEFFISYLSELSPFEKKNIFSEIIDIPVGSNEQILLRAILVQAGPQLQKMLQIIARDGFLPEPFRSEVEKLESQGEAVPWIAAEEIIKKSSPEVEWISIENKPLGVGTLAQVHRARVRFKDGTEKDVVVRFLKPRILLRIEREAMIMKKIAPRIDNLQELKEYKLPRLQNLVEQITRTVSAEADLPATWGHQAKAIRDYSRVYKIKSEGQPLEIEFKVPGLISEASNRIVTIQEFAEGEKLDSFLLKYPELASVLASYIARHWYDVALLKTGFFHGDLHRGNYLVKRTPEGRVVVTLIDYGMSGELSLVQRKSILLLYLASEFTRADMVAKFLWKLSDPDKNALSSREFLERAKGKMMESKAAGEHIGPREWIAWATEQGLYFSQNISLLFRGTLVISRLLNQHNIEHFERRFMWSMFVDNISYMIKIGIEAGWELTKSMFVPERFRTMKQNPKVKLESDTKPVDKIKPAVPVMNCRELFQ